MPRNTFQGRRAKDGGLAAGEWPKVMQRYLGGEQTDAIARDHDCSRAAVIRVVRRYLLRFGQLTAGLGAPSNPPAGLDPALGSRLTSAMIRFLETFDAARRGSDDTAIDELCESTDQLMRAVARMRIELGRATLHGRR